jgi:hypothetical protein
VGCPGPAADVWAQGAEAQERAVKGGFLQRSQVRRAGVGSGTWSRGVRPIQPTDPSPAPASGTNAGGPASRGMRRDPSRDVPVCCGGRMALRSLPWERRGGVCAVQCRRLATVTRSRRSGSGEGRTCIWGTTQALPGPGSWCDTPLSGVPSRRQGGRHPAVFSRFRAAPAV